MVFVVVDNIDRRHQDNKFSITILNISSVMAYFVFLIANNDQTEPNKLTHFLCLYVFS